MTYIEMKRCEKSKLIILEFEDDLEMSEREVNCYSLKEINWSH